MYAPVSCVMWLQTRLYIVGVPTGGGKFLHLDFADRQNYKYCWNWGERCGRSRCCNTKCSKLISSFICGWFYKNKKKDRRSTRNSFYQQNKCSELRSCFIVCHVVHLIFVLPVWWLKCALVDIYVCRGCNGEGGYFLRLGNMLFRRHIYCDFSLWKHHTEWLQNHSLYFSKIYRVVYLSTYFVVIHSFVRPWFSKCNHYFPEILLIFIHM